MIIADSDKKPGSGKTPSFNDLGGCVRHLAPSRVSF
jgi:hypothetical protein